MDILGIKSKIDKINRKCIEILTKYDKMALCITCHAIWTKDRLRRRLVRISGRKVLGDPPGWRNRLMAACANMQEEFRKERN